MLNVGLTGGIGSGKSVVSALLCEHGAVVIDSDLIAREVVAPGTPGLAAVVAEFGRGVLREDGTLDRPALGRVVFADADRRAALNAIVHPLVAERSRALRRAAAPDAVVVHDVPLLVENGMTDRFDLVVVVDAADEVRRERLVALRGMTEREAAERMAAQADRATRLAAADVVIDNDGSLDHLAEQVDKLWARLTG